MATLVLKEETSYRLVFTSSPDTRKGNVFSNWIKKNKSETTIILDLGFQKITRTKTIPRRPVEQIELAFDRVRNVTLFAADCSPMPEFNWPSAVALILLDESSFVFDSGRWAETQPLARKLSELINKSLEEKIVGSPKDFPK